MNLRCKHILLICTVVLLSLLSGCIKDDYEDCTQGINVRFYSKTSCQLDTVYPEDIKDINLCIFDKDGTLVAHQKTNSIELSRNYSQTVELSSGLYYAIAWSGVDSEHFDISELENGRTQKGDLLFRLKRLLNHAYSLQGIKVYYGQSEAVYVPDAKGSQSIFENTMVNMQEVTNRITISVEGLDTRALEDFEIEIESDNGSMDIDGTIAEDETIEYDPDTTSPRVGVLESRFTMLKLETGHTNTIVIRNKISGAELFRGSLLGALLLKNPDVNLACDHDFTIRFTTQDQCSCGTYTIMEIWVNNWLVHSYDTEI